MKRQTIILAVLLVLFSGNLIRTNAIQSIRAVDLLQVLACGALLGVLLTRAFSSRNS